MLLTDMKNKNTFIFDFDGTLFHLFTGYDFTDVSNKLYDALKAFDIDFPQIHNPFEVFKEIKAQSKSDDIFKAANKVASDLLLEIELDAAKTTGVWVKGAIESLKYLYDNGYKVAIASNNSTESIKICMDRDLAGYNIPYIGRCRDHCERLKPSAYMIDYLLDKIDGKAKDCVFFGDHPRDMDCAIAAGTSFFGVTPTRLKKERMLAVLPEDETMDDLFVLLNELKK